MKKIYCMLIVILLTFSLCSCKADEEENSKYGICYFPNCGNNARMIDGVYTMACYEHTCEIRDCDEIKEYSGTTHYCQYHKDKVRTLTSDEEQKVISVINIYCDSLMSKQKSIRAIHIIGKPEVISNSITYRCNVVRDDSDTNLATIKVLLIDGEYKVQTLIYDSD